MEMDAFEAVVGSPPFDNERTGDWSLENPRRGARESRLYFRSLKTFGVVLLAFFKVWGNQKCLCRVVVLHTVCLYLKVDDRVGLSVLGFLATLCVAPSHLPSFSNNVAILYYFELQRESTGLLALSISAIQHKIKNMENRKYIKFPPY
jgi:hypothetical protein